MRGPEAIDCAEFAELAKVSLRTARRLLSACHAGGTWRGQELQVQRVHGRGGKRGWQYQVAVASLPPELRPNGTAAVPMPAEAVPQVTPYAPAAGAVPDYRRKIADWRFLVIEPALDCPPGSPARGRAVKLIAAREHIGPDGGKVTVSKATVGRWIKGYEEQGRKGLYPAWGKNRHRRLAYVSRRWDSAVPFDDAKKAEIGAAVERYIRAVWANTLGYGWKKVNRLTEHKLRELTVQAGFDPGPKRLKAACTVGKRAVMRWRSSRADAIYARDKKRWVDESRPRIHRNLPSEPMEIVVGDVHYDDTFQPREDGSTYTARLISWLDWATHRSFEYWVFPKKGEGVRQEHVAEAYVEMVKAWGVPRHLYLDNGGEYDFADIVDDLQQLGTVVHYLGADEKAEVAKRRSSIVRAMVRNAPAKIVEGHFGGLELWASALPGFAGGDRMAKKTGDLHKAPKPFPGTKADYLRLRRTILEAYETHPQEGLLNGRSPRQVYNEHVARGWGRTAISENELRAALARSHSRTIKQGGFRLENCWYTSRELQELPAGTKVLVRVPIWRARDHLVVWNEHEQFLCVASRDQLYDPLDPAGAKEAAERVRVSERAARHRRRELEDVDIMADLARMVADEEPEAVAPDLATVSLGDQYRQSGAEMADLPVRRRQRADEEYERQLERESQARRKLLAAWNGDKERASG